ncbi:aspartic proteinase 36-like [Impatiens glandulifera]|uniref:aspartic proteinase 36-like n=1 Tax=Impatiens glandulifera TaxID=253017 RepID=UPI001FB14D09|nr:aspartic proteinase 36-like [Impatiens glandulifera]
MSTTMITTLTFLIVIYSTALVVSHKIMILERVVLKTNDVEKQDRARHAKMGIVNFTVVVYDPAKQGLYYTTIKLGSPAKEFHFEPNFYDIATSSSASTISCYDPLCIPAGVQCANESNPCPFGIKYEDGNVAFGYYVTDLLHFDAINPHSLAVENSSARILFACSTFLKGMLTRENRAVDGILGLSYAHPSTISQLENKGIIPRKFSHCFGRDNRGVLIMDGNFKETTGIVYTPLMPSSYVILPVFPLPINPSVYNALSGVRTIMDTGTVLAYLIPETYDALINAIDATVTQQENDVRIDILPQVSFNFAGNASLVLTPLDYITDFHPIIVRS